MSENEKKKRQDYKAKRKKWIIFQFVAICLILVIGLGSLIAYREMSKAYYIHYTEMVQ